VIDLPTGASEFQVELVGFDWFRLSVVWNDRQLCRHLIHICAGTD